MTFMVTTVRIIVEASPTILGGVVVAAWLRTQATPEKIKSIFVGTGWQGSIRTVLVGMALPVCAIGILPVLRELRQLGLPTKKLITLGISAPLLNPFSLLFGLSVLSFPQYLMMLSVTGLVVIVVGEICSRFAVGEKFEAEPRPAGLTGGTRLKNLLIASGRHMTGRVSIDLIFTIIVAALTVSLIKYEAFLEVCDPANSSGPAVASMLTTTQYVSPSRAIIQFGGINNANLSIATGLAIYMFGTSVCGASLFAFFRRYGWRRLVALAFAVFVMVNLFCYLISSAIPVAGEVAETTAIENLSRSPYESLDEVINAISDSMKFLDTFMLFSSIAIGVLFLIGVYVRYAKIEFVNDAPEAAAEQESGRMSKALPASQLGAVAVCLVAIISFFSTFVFFPGPNEVMEEMVSFQLDTSVAIRTGNAKEAIDRIALWDSAAASVPIGAAVRGRLPTPLQRKLTRELRTELRTMRELLSDGDVASARQRLANLEQLFIKTKNSFKKGGANVQQPTS